MDRKNFLKSSFLICGAIMTGASILESCSKTGYAPTPVSVNFTLDLNATANSALKTVGGYVEGNNAIVIRTGTSTYIALSNICTHAGCTVNYEKASNDIYCPCHGGTYDLSGNVTGGPPPSPLQLFKTSLSGHILTVTS